MTSTNAQPSSQCPSPTHRQFLITAARLCRRAASGGEVGDADDADGGAVGEGDEIVRAHGGVGAVDAAAVEADMAVLRQFLGA